MPRSDSPAFIAEGREDQLDQLQAVMDSVLGGEPQIAFVTGDAGTGKTAIVGEFCRRSQEANENLVVAWGQCSAQLGLSDPYLPFKEILALLTGDIEGSASKHLVTDVNANRLWRLLGQAGEAVVELGPDLVGVFVPGGGLLARAGTYVAKKVGWVKKLEKIARKQPDREDYRPEQLFEQFSRVLIRIAEKAPIILVLDDLHWADAGSLDLLFYLTRRFQEARELSILILGTYRLADVRLGREGTRHPLDRVNSEVRRYWGDVEIALDPTVGSESGRAFINALLDVEPNRLDEEFRASLFRQTGGHPLFTIELLSGLKKSRYLSRDPQDRWVSRKMPFDQLPRKVEAVIAERTDQLESGLMAILTCGSVEGEIFTAEVVARVRQIEKLALAGTLDEELVRRHGLLVPAGEIQVNGQMIHHYRFKHVLYQQYLYERLSPFHRKQLHGAVGDALEVIHGEGAGEIAGVLARHFDLAAMIHKAILYYFQAAEHARSGFAFVDAERTYQRALELLDDAHKPMYEFKILYGLEQVYELLGERDKQRSILGRMVDVSNTNDDLASLATTRNRFALYYERIGDYQASRVEAEAGRSAAQRAQSQQIESESLLRLAAGSYWQNMYSEAYREASAALEIATNLNDMGLKAGASNLLGLVHWDIAEYEKATQYVKQALEISRESNNRIFEASSLTNIGLISYDLADYEMAWEYHELAYDMAHQIGDRYREASSLNNLGLINYDLAYYTDALQMFDRSMLLFRAISEPGGEGLGCNNIGLVHLSLGRYVQARKDLEAALQIFQAIGDQINEAFALANFGKLENETGDSNSSKVHLEKALTISRSVAARRAESYILNFLGQAMESIGKRAEADLRYADALKIRRELGQHALAIDSKAGLARIALGQDSLASASSYVDEILIWIDEHGIDGVEEPLRAYLTCIEVSAALGEHERASKLHDQARELLMTRALRIEDPLLRQSFFENVQVNREIYSGLGNRDTSVRFGI